MQKQAVFHSLDLKSHEIRLRRAKPRGIPRRMYAASQISWDSHGGCMWQAKSRWVTMGRDWGVIELH